MTRDEAEAGLVASLQEVRRRFDDKADDWDYSLLRTFREYLSAIGVERRLIDPVQALLLSRADEIMNERRRNAGEIGTPRPSGHTLAMAYAAAAVTTLRNRHSVKLTEAVSRVAAAAGLAREDISRFRDNVSRGRAPRDAKPAHDAALAEMREKAYSVDEILTAVRGIGKFVG
jgi:hypothetical protein